MREKDLKFGIAYLQWLLYIARSAVSLIKSSSKASEGLRTFQNNRCLRTHFKAGGNPITEPEGDDEEENEGNSNGGYGNEDCRTCGLVLRAPEL